MFHIRTGFHPHSKLVPDIVSNSHVTFSRGATCDMVSRWSHVTWCHIPHSHAHYTLSAVDVVLLSDRVTRLLIS